MGTTLDGKLLSEKIRSEIQYGVIKYAEKGYRKPGIAVILVGDDYASSLYVSLKEKACKNAGFNSFIKRLDYNIETDDLLDLITGYNDDSMVDGILVQLPLPSHIDEEKVLLSVNPDKDVDGFHPYNVGMLSIGSDALFPCTPLGVLKLLEHYEIAIEGRHCVIVGASNIVGKPMASMMLRNNATVSICHKYTKDLQSLTLQADILISAVGKANFITHDYVRGGSVIIDVGMNRLNGKIVGDIDFDSVKEKSSYITPVPGGVGPMTITMLLYNTLKSFKNHTGC